LATARRPGGLPFRRLKRLISHTTSLGLGWVECTGLINNVRSGSMTEFLGQPDDQKLQSSITLFEVVSDDPVFTASIGRYYSNRDQVTLEILAL
jgi:uncharacterized protein (DUF1810 family)